MKHKGWLLSIGIFILIGCNSTKSLPTATISPTPENIATQISANFPNLKEILQVSKVRSIELKNDWTGLAYIYYLIEQHYSLAPIETTFTGHVNFKLIDEHGKTTTENQNLQIPIKDINLFIEKLAETTFVQGEYIPSIKWTDDYPEIAITIELQTENISFYTSSQGDRHIPWGMSYHNKTYIIDSSTPMNAIDILGVYLKNDRLKELVEEASKESLLPYHDPKTTNEPTHIP